MVLTLPPDGHEHHLCPVVGAVARVERLLADAVGEQDLVPREQLPRAVGSAALRHATHHQWTALAEI